MYKSYLILGSKGVLRRKTAILSPNKEDAINNLYKEGVTMANALSQDVYLCVTDVNSGKKTMYLISKGGKIEEISVVS